MGYLQQHLPKIMATKLLLSMVQMHQGLSWCDLSLLMQLIEDADKGDVNLVEQINRWSKTGLWEDPFLAFEQKLIRNGYSQTEAMFAVISMQVELGLVKIEQLDKAMTQRLSETKLEAII